MNYDEMSVFEVNEMVSRYFDNLTYYFLTDNSEYVWDETSGREWDGCKNPLDAWPIINGNAINLEFEFDGTCTARKVSIYEFNNEPSEYKGETNDENALKAAMICFLKIKEHSNE